jgi:hypothetical protein
MQVTTFSWVRSTPFGSPVVPLVYIIVEMSCLDGGVRSTEFSFPWIIQWSHKLVLFIVFTYRYTITCLNQNFHRSKEKLAVCRLRSPCYRAMPRTTLETESLLKLYQKIDSITILRPERCKDNFLKLHHHKV